MERHVMRASEMARLLDARLDGGGDPELTGVAPLDRAGPADLGLLAARKYLSYVPPSRAGALLVSEELAGELEDARPRIVVPDAHAALVTLLPELYPEPRPEPGVHPTAVVSDDAELGADVSVGPHVVVGGGTTVGARARIGAHTVVGAGCAVGEDVVLHAHVTLYDGVRVGERSIIHSGARIGVDGFGYAQVDGVPRKIPQVGTVHIGADVEIGANTTVDRGSIGTTEIGDGVKIDNLVQVAHNVRIGAYTVIAAQSGIAGSTTLGTGVTLGGQAGIRGHVHIGDGARIAAQAGVFGDVPAGVTYSGYPARPHREALRAQAGTFRIPKLAERLRRLEQRLDDDGEG